MVSQTNKIRCIGIQCAPKHTSHDRRTRPIQRAFDDRIQTLPKSGDPRIRPNWKFTFAPTCAGKCRSCAVDNRRPLPTFDSAASPNTTAQTPAQLWMELSKFVNIARRSTHPTMANAVLASAAKQTTGTVLEAIFKFWIGDNFRIEGEWHEALDVYRSILRDGQEFTFLGHPIVPRVLECVSECLAQMGAVDEAVDALVAVTRTPRPDTALSYTWYKIGTMLEQDGQTDRAKLAYARAAHASDARPIPGARWKDLAERAILQMDGDHVCCRSSPNEAVRALKNAIKQRNEAVIRSLASDTHFHVGGATCDRCFTEGPDYMNAFIEDLRASKNVTVREDPSLPSGTKQHLLSHGWEGKTFWGTLLFTIERTPYGWAWTGVSVTTSTPGLQILHQQQFGIAAKEGNQDMQLVIKAPWPAGTQNFAAGGFTAFLDTYIGVVFALGIGVWALLAPLLLAELPGLIIVGLAAAAALTVMVGALIEGAQRHSQARNWDANVTLGAFAGALVTPWLAFWFASLNPCGFGVRGFYYGNEPTHLRFTGLEDSYHAIDFMRNTRGLPFVNSAVNELILAVADGVVVAGNLFDPPDSHFQGNFIEITHIDRSQFSELDAVIRNDSTLFHDSGAVLNGQRDPQSRLGAALLARQGGVPRVRRPRRIPRLRVPIRTTATAFGGPLILSSEPRYDRYGSGGPVVSTEQPISDDPPGTVPFDPQQAHSDATPIGSQGAPGEPMLPNIPAEPIQEPPSAENVVGSNVVGFVDPVTGRPYRPVTADPASEPTPEPADIPARPPIPDFGRYSSRYRHMQPRGLVSLFQYVLMGTPIAQIGSTGNSASPHLHFEMHDRDLLQQNTADPLGASVKPSPMDVDADGRPQFLNENDEGRCVHSTNAIDESPARFRP